MFCKKQIQQEKKAAKLLKKKEKDGVKAAKKKEKDAAKSVKKKTKADKAKAKVDEKLKFRKVYKTTFGHVR